MYPVSYFSCKKRTAAKHDHYSNLLNNKLYYNYLANGSIADEDDYTEFKKLEKKIKKGQSSRVTAMQFGCSPSQIRREAAKIGLKFNGKLNWNNNAN